MAAGNQSDDDGLEEAFDAAMREAFDDNQESPPTRTGEFLPRMSEQQRRLLDEACRKIKEIAEGLTHGSSDDVSTPKREPTAHQVIYNWISGRPAK